MNGGDFPTPSGSWSKGSSSTGGASSGSNVLKYSGTSSSQISLIDVAAQFTAAPTKYVVYAVAQQTSGSDSFMLQATGATAFGGEDDGGEWVQCSDTVPTCYRLGEFNVPSGGGYLSIKGKSSGSGSVNGELDRLIIMKVSNESYVIRTYDKTVYSDTVSYTVDLQQQALTSLSPRFGFIRDGSTFNQLPHNGDLNVYMSGDTVMAAWVALEGDWQLTISGNTAIQVTAKRRKARMVAT
jgi:hypothetical protein